MPVLAQHIIVTLAAIVAAAIIVRRVFTTVRPDAGAAPKCASCPSAGTHGQRRDVASTPPLDAGAQPLVVIKSTQR